MPDKDNYDLIDCDGVLSNFTLACEEACEDMGIVLPWDGTTYDVFAGLEQLHKKRLMHRIHRRGFVEDMEPLEGAQDGIDDLRMAGRNLICLTSPWRTKVWEVERRAWLKKHFGFKGTDVIQTPRKSLVRGVTLLDDKPSNCQSWAVRNGSPALLWDTPYNREPPKGRPDQLDMIRVQSWEEVLSALEVM